MVSGGRSSRPTSAHGPLIFLFAPLRTLASPIIDFRRRPQRAGRCARPLYAFALLLLFSAFVLSLAGYLIKLPLRKYQVRG